MLVFSCLLLPFCWNRKTHKTVSKDAGEDEDAKERAQPVVRGPLRHLDIDDDYHDVDADDDDDDDDENASSQSLINT